MSAVFVEVFLRLGGTIYSAVQESANKTARGESGAIRILCLGESTTAGINAYPKYLEEILNSRNTGVRFSVINKGEIGMDSGYILENLEDNIAKYAPHIITVMMGINDKEDTREYNTSATKAGFLQSLRIYKLVKFIIMHVKSRKLFSALKPGPDRLYAGTGPADSVGHEKKPAEDVSRDKDDYRSYIKLGVFYREHADAEKSIEVFKKAVKADPGKPEGYKQLSLSYNLVGKHEAAKKALLDAFANKAEDVTIYEELGEYYWKQKDTKRAERTYLEAIGRFPNEYRLYQRLSLLYEEEGNPALAGKYSMRAEALLPKNYDASDVTRKNYTRLREIVLGKKIKLLCIQYPLRSVSGLKDMMGAGMGEIYVDNEGIFRNAVREGGYFEYFKDVFAGDFGHCTEKGHRLLAGNIADTVINGCIDKRQD